MKTYKLPAAILILALALPFSARVAIPPPPDEVASEYGFAALDQATMKTLLRQGSMVIVRHKDDMSLKNVTAGKLVNATIEEVWAVITDFERYPEFMPRTETEKILERDGNRLLVEQTLAVKIWRLPVVDISYKLGQELTPPNKVRFWHIGGTLEGTYGGWDLVPVGSQTMIFYTLYSNLTAMGWGLGGLFKKEPDFMAGVNVTTALMVTKAVKEESERRAAKK